MDFSSSSMKEWYKRDRVSIFRRHKSIRVSAFFVVFAVIFSMTAGCTVSSDTPFPKVTQPAPEDSSIVTPAGSDPSASVSESTAGSVLLKVAAPISNDTAQYLARLYTLKESGEWNVQQSGSTVSLDVLDATIPSFSVEILQTPSTGATEDTILQWKDSGFVPDIICTDALSKLMENGDILPLSDYAASNSLYLPTSVYTPMLDTCSIDDLLYGIPYSASAQILYVNMNVLEASGVDSVPFNLDLDTLTSISEAVRVTSTEETPLEEQKFAFYKASDLLSFLPSSFSNKTGWLMFNGKSFNFSAGSFKDTVTFLRSYVAAGYSVESLTPEDQALAFSSLDPRLSNRVAFWSGSTSEVSLWSENQAYTLSIARIPAENAETDSRLALTVYPLCISSETESPQLACDFASFIALDEDAVLLSARLENREGLLPVVSSSAVWNAICLQQTFGEELLLLKDKVPEAYFNPVTNHGSEYLLARQILNQYSTPLMDSKIDLQTLIVSLSNTRLDA